MAPSLLRCIRVFLPFREIEVEYVFQWHAFRGKVDARWQRGDLRDGQDCQSALAVDMMGRGTYYLPMLEAHVAPAKGRRGRDSRQSSHGAPSPKTSFGSVSSCRQSHPPEHVLEGFAALTLPGVREARTLVSPSSAFSSDDLPTFGWPTRPIVRG